MYLFDVREGVAGDMILGTLIDAKLCSFNDIKSILESSARFMDPAASVIVKKETIGNDFGTTINVNHKDFDGIDAVDMIANLNKAIDELGLSESKQLANKIFDTIINAEAKVHKKDIKDLHLHETGSPDTLVDIIGISKIITDLNTDFKSTPIAVGYGKVKIAHGVFEIPPPATAVILKGMDWFKGQYEGEMATPTGTAVLRNIIDKQITKFENGMTKIGTGFGSKTFQGKRTAVRLYRW